MTDAYQEFLASKLATVPPTGIEDIPPLGEYLFPFQQDLVRWALRRGKAALFESVGLGKTRQAGEFASQASAHLEAVGEPSEVLMLAPLGVTAQSVRELNSLGMPAIARELLFKLRKLEAE